MCTTAGFASFTQTKHYAPLIPMSRRVPSTLGETTSPPPRFVSGSYKSLTNSAFQSLSNDYITGLWPTLCLTSSSSLVMLNNVIVTPLSSLRLGVPPLSWGPPDLWPGCWPQSALRADSAPGAYVFCLGMGESALVGLCMVGWP